MSFFWENIDELWDESDIVWEVDQTVATIKRVAAAGEGFAVGCRLRDWVFRPRWQPPAKRPLPLPLLQIGLDPELVAPRRPNWRMFVEAAQVRARGLPIAPILLPSTSRARVVGLLVDPGRLMN
jgi:hypothetical protein